MGKQVEKLSDVQIRRWIKAGEPVAKADGDGLTFTLSTGGTAAWVLRYRFGGKPRELTLGRYPDKALTEARDDARKARASIQNGIDVAREKQIAGIERAAARSFRQLATDYMDKVFPALAANTIKQRKQHIEKVILPKLGNIPAREVTTADIVSMVESVGKKSINVAELVFTAVSEILKHGVARHVVAANPCAHIKACSDGKSLRWYLRFSDLWQASANAPTSNADRSGTTGDPARASLYRPTERADGENSADNLCPHWRTRTGGMDACGF